jgi:flagellar FliL protein
MVYEDYEDFLLEDDIEDEPIEEKKSKLPLILGAVALVVLTGGGAYAYLAATDSGDDAGNAASADGEGEEEETGVVITSLGAFTVNLRDSAGGRVLQMEVQVEGDSGGVPVIEERMPQLKDSVLLLTSDYTYADLEGVDGKMRLRDEVYTRVNAVIKPHKITRVYFTAFVVQ